MKILNLYAGIGGNRKLWGVDHEITSIEYIPEVAEVYQHYYPSDTVVVADAHQYLLDHYKEFDFIWSSPPCPTHSVLKRVGISGGRTEAVYPEMSLYQEIILLKSFAPEGVKWCIENVKPYYDPLIPAIEMGRHLFWTNFDLKSIKINDERKHMDIKGSSTVYGYNLGEFKIKEKRKILRNMVNPEVGLHILNESQGVKNETHFKQQTLI